MAQRVGYGRRIGVDDQMEIAFDALGQCDLYRLGIGVTRLEHAAVRDRLELRVIRVERGIVRQEDGVGPVAHARVAVADVGYRVSDGDRLPRRGACRHLQAGDLEIGLAVSDVKGRGDAIVGRVFVSPVGEERDEIGVVAGIDRRVAKKFNVGRIVVAADHGAGPPADHLLQGLVGEEERRQVVVGVEIDPQVVLTVGGAGALRQRDRGRGNVAVAGIERAGPRRHHGAKIRGPAADEGGIGRHP